MARLNVRTFAIPLIVVASVLAVGFSASEAFAQATTCPSMRRGDPIPLDLGVDAATRREWTLAARYFEQHKACVEQNRPNVRDSYNGLAAFRLANAYLQAQDMVNTLRVADEALAWHRSYVASLSPGEERSDQFQILIFLHGARALALMRSDPTEAEDTLDRARVLLERNRQERPISALMVLAMLSTLIEDDYPEYVLVQRELIQRLREFGAEYRGELRQELLNFARNARAHGDSGLAATLEAEAGSAR